MTCIRRPTGEVGVYDPKNPLNPIRKYRPTTPFQPLNYSPRPLRKSALPKMSMPMYPSLMALQAGLAKHYVPMESLFGEVIEQSRSSS